MTPRRPLTIPVVALTWLLSAAAPAAAQDPTPWQSDNGDGTYTNPVLFADYSDPDAVADGGEFYLTASSFNCVPGLPILHSRDLVNWQIVNHALPRLYDEAFDRPQHGNGVWAPSLRQHDGWFYIYWGDPDRGIYMVRTQDPRGDWSEPTLVKQAHGNIDPCPLWDDDGKVYMVHAFAHSRAGINSLLSVVELSPDGTQAIDKGWIVYDGHGDNPTVEGPKFYKRNGYYYIFAPAGGVAEGWQLVLRSRNVRGPYEVRRVLSQGATEVNGPHQGAWVQAPDGSDWFLHFQDAGPYGRIVHLQPLRWIDNWPVIGDDADGDGEGEPVLRHAKPVTSAVVTPHGPVASDKCDGPELGLQWQWHGNPQESWASLDARQGWLRLAATPRPAEFRNLWDTSSLLLQKFPAPEFVARCTLDGSDLREGESAGMLVMGRDYAYVAVERSAKGWQVVGRRCRHADTGREEATVAEEQLASPRVELRVVVRDGAVCEFEYLDDGGNWQTIGPAFQAREGRWIGAKVGLFCQSPTAAEQHGHADVDRFIVERLPPSDSAKTGTDSP